MINFILYFFIYAFAGWACETVFFSIIGRTFVNRGLLTGPLMVIYGIIPVLGIFFLEPYKNNWPILTLGLIIVSGVCEIILCVASDKILHARLWDYSDRRLNILGYTCFSSAFVRGLLSMLVIKLIHPTLARLIHMIPFSVRMIIGIVLLTLLCLDFLISIISVHGILQENKQVQFVLGHLGRLGEKLAASLSSLHNRTKEPRHIKWYKKHLNKNKAQLTKTESCPLPFGAGKSVYKLFWIFIIGSVIGYIVETIFIYLTTGIWMNRSSLLYGPFSVVWGLGAVVLTLVLYGWNEKSDRYIFLGGLLIGGVYEYACSVFTEFFFGSVFWDYSGLPFNINGRVNLLYCGFWGLLALLWVKGIYPYISRAIEKIPIKPGKVITLLLGIFLSADMLLSAAALARMENRAKNAAANNAVEVFLDKTYDDQYISKRYQNLKPVFKNIK